jgi:hypothetical protein
MGFQSGVLPRRGFGKMPNPAAKMAALPKDVSAYSRILAISCGQAMFGWSRDRGK